MRNQIPDSGFLALNTGLKKNIIEGKSDAGYFNISSPALTAADLVHHQSRIGGINRMLANIEELAEEITENDMADLLSWYP